MQVSAAQSQAHRMNECVFLPVTSHFDFLGPDARVQAPRKVLVQDGAVGVIGHGRQAIVHEETDEADTEQHTNDGNDSDPFLLGILLFEPRLFDFGLVDSAGVKVVWRSAGLQTSG